MNKRAGTWPKRLSCGMLLIIGLGTVACAPLGPPNPVNVILKRDGLALATKKAAIPDFYVPEHGAGLGQPLADKLQAIAMERSLFQETSRNLPVVWTHPGETQEARFAGLAQTAALRGFDFVLIGVVDQLFYGGLEDTTLALTLRLLDARTGSLLFVASHRMVSKPKDPSYPLDTKLISPADSPVQLADKLLRLIVARMQ